MIERVFIFVCVVVFGFLLFAAVWSSFVGYQNRAACFAAGGVVVKGGGWIVGDVTCLKADQVLRP